MPTNANFDNLSQWQDLIAPNKLNEAQITDAKIHLELLLLALKTIADLDSEAILQAVGELNLESVVADKTIIKQLTADYPKDSNSQTNIDEVRSLVLIICYLAQKHQELLRRTVSLLEVTEQNQSLYQTTLLENYWHKFVEYYRAKTGAYINKNHQSWDHLAWKLLIDLLFYSGTNGHCLLWGVIFPSA